MLHSDKVEGVQTQEYDMVVFSATVMYDSFPPGIEGVRRTQITTLYVCKHAHTHTHINTNMPSGFSGVLKISL